MEVIMDTAYSDGFVKEDDITTELPDDVGSGLVDVLDVETYRTTFDHCDAGYVPARVEDD
jgi:hypothetical protein